MKRGFCRRQASAPPLPGASLSALRPVRLHTLADRLLVLGADPPPRARGRLAGLLRSAGGTPARTIAQGRERALDGGHLTVDPGAVGAELL